MKYQWSIHPPCGNYTGRQFLSLQYLLTEQFKGTSRFLHKPNVKSLLQENISETSPHIILGGDFNMIFDTSLDCFGGNPKIEIVPEIVNDIMLENDLVDIWRIRNVGKKRFTWRNSSSGRTP